MTRLPATVFAMCLLLCLVAGPSGADEDILARVEAGLREAESYGGASYHLTDRIAALGPAAVPAVAAVLADTKALDARRVLAAGALGRMAAPEALVALHATLARDDLSEDLRTAVEDSCFLAGDTEPVDRRIAMLATKHRDLPFTATGAHYRLARTYAATGRFRVAAALMKDLVAMEHATRPQVAQSHAYDWACYAALAGNKAEAVDASRIAVESERADLEWMAKDLDLVSVQGEEGFIRLLADAKARKGAKTPTGKDLRSEPGYAEYDALQDAYGKVFMARIEANNRYWGGYEAWLEKRGQTPGPDATAAYTKEMGPEPVDSTPEWIPRFQALLEKYRGTPIGREARAKLLTILANHRDMSRILELYLGGLAEDPPLDSLVRHASTALFAADHEHRTAEVRAALSKAVAAHPNDPGAAELLLALAEGLEYGANAEAVRAAYAEILRRFPETASAKQAEDALYELNTLVDGSPAPEFGATDVRGRTWALSALRGKVVLLDYWATWCGPCLGELPTMKAIQEEHADGSKDDFLMLGISLDADGWSLAEFLEREKLRWPQLCDLRAFDGALAKLYHVTGIPRTVLIDRKGRIVAKDLRGEELKKAVRQALDATK